MEKVLVEILTAIYTFLLGVLSNPVIVSAVVVWLMSYVPGPLKTIATALINLLLEQAKKLLEERKDQAVQDAVALAEQLGKNQALSGEEKKLIAMSHVAQRVEISRNDLNGRSELSDRIEAEVKRLKTSLF